MSDPTDIKALDEYLKRGSDVSQRYRELGRDEVPPELDRRVLAAARDAVAKEGTQRSRSWLRWSTPLALAASVVLVVTVVIERGAQDETVLLPPSQSDVRQVRSDVAADDVVPDDKALGAAGEAKLAEQVAREPGIVPPAPAPVVPSAPAPIVAQDAVAKAAKPEAERSNSAQLETYEEVRALRDQAPAQAQLQSTPVTVVPVEPAAPPPAAAPVERSLARNSVERAEAEADSADLQEVVITGRARRATGRTAGPRGTVSIQSSSESAAAADAREQSDPEEWLEDIRDLRRAGKTAEADREWLRFREAFPAFNVADDDIARKK